MSEPYIGEIRPFAFGDVPEGWLLCDGGLLPIEKYQQLFSVIVTTYGGDGISTFALPDLRGRTGIGMVEDAELGDKGGVETVTLSQSTIPTHTHALYASVDLGTTTEYEGNVLGGSKAYSAATPNGEMIANTLAEAGGEKAHDNMQPFLTLNFCICAAGQNPRS